MSNSFIPGKADTNRKITPALLIKWLSSSFLKMNCHLGSSDIQRTIATKNINEHLEWQTDLKRKKISERKNIFNDFRKIKYHWWKKKENISGAFMSARTNLMFRTDSVNINH